jgi:hypothetical protein
MTTVTAPSAYPPVLEELLPQARALAEALGEIPSRNALMKHFHIGDKKAKALLKALEDRPDEPAAVPAEPAPIVRHGSLRQQAYEVLDTYVPVGDRRDVVALTTFVSDMLDLDDVERLTASNYVRVWQQQRQGHVARSAAPEPPAPRPLHAVPDLPADPEPDAEPTEAPAPVEAPPVTASLLATGAASPGPNITSVTVPAAARVVRKRRSWPVWLLALPAFVSVWAGWVGLGELTGFGEFHPLPGIVDGLTINTAITLPIGVETYAAYALSVWLTGAAPVGARRFAKWSAIGSLIFGAAAQVAYHLLTAAGITHAPWQITTAVACLPVAVLGMGAALAHLIHANHDA